MDPIKTPALVLGSYHFGESDKRVILLTREAGKRTAIAKGGARVKSKFGARILPLCHIDTLIAPGRNLDILTQCETIDLYPKIHTVPARLEVGLRMAEFLQQAVPTGSPIPHIYQLFLEFVEALKGSSAPHLLSSAFLIQFLEMEGLSPRLDQCAVCKKSMQRPPKKIAFGSQEGGILCRSCADARPDAAILPYLCIEDIIRWKTQKLQEFSHTTPLDQAAILLPTLHHYALQALS